MSSTGFSTQYRRNSILRGFVPSWRIVASVAVMLFLLTGCGYRLSGSHESRLFSGQSLWVAFIDNVSTSATAQTVIRRALLEEGHAMRGLPPSAAEAGADFIVTGSLRTYSNRAVAYDQFDRVAQYRLSIEVELELRRKGETSPHWKGTIHAFQDYPANIQNLTLQHSAEEAALSAASSILAQKFFTSVAQDY